ncbi:MAG: transposase [Rhodoferax sp.]|nr:transposase [Rhodoferax sp.]
MVEAVAGEADTTAPSVIFHPASGIESAAMAQAQLTLRKRIMRAFVRCDLIEKLDAKEMLAYQHSGFSLDAGVRIEERDRAALERLLRYCARPPLAMDRLRKEGRTLVYRCAKQHSEPASGKRGFDRAHLRSLPAVVSDMWWHVVAKCA